MTQRIPYELLTRYDKVGPTGAHVVFQILDDEGNFLGLSDAIPLGLEDFPTSEIMLDTMKVALIQIANLNRKITERDKQIGDLEGKIQDLQTQNDGLGVAYTNLKNAVQQASQQSFSFMPSAL